MEKQITTTTQYLQITVSSTYLEKTNQLIAITTPWQMIQFCYTERKKDLSDFPSLRRQSGTILKCVCNSLYQAVEQANQFSQVSQSKIKKQKQKTNRKNNINTNNSSNHIPSTACLPDLNWMFACVIQFNPHNYLKKWIIIIYIISKEAIVKLFVQKNTANQQQTQAVKAALLNFLEPVCFSLV